VPLLWLILCVTLVVLNTYVPGSVMYVLLVGFASSSVAMYLAIFNML
jgi:hypothetical protein